MAGDQVALSAVQGAEGLDNFRQSRHKTGVRQPLPQLLGQGGQLAPARGPLPVEGVADLPQTPGGKAEIGQHLTKLLKRKAEKRARPEMRLGMSRQAAGSV